MKQVLVTEEVRQLLLSKLNPLEPTVDYAVLKYLDVIKQECLIDEFYITFDEEELCRTQTKTKNL